MKNVNKDIFLCIKILVVTVGLIIVLFLVSGTTFSTGYYYDGNIFISDNEPICGLSDLDIFEGLDMGDKIIVIHGTNVEDSYPSRVDVYLYFKIQDGNADNISQDVLDTFTTRSD